MAGCVVPGQFEIAAARCVAVVGIAAGNNEPHWSEPSNDSTFLMACCNFAPGTRRCGDISVGFVAYAKRAVGKQPMPGMKCVVKHPRLSLDEAMHLRHGL
jgi:hypothetical protein